MEIQSKERKIALFIAEEAEKYSIFNKCNYPPGKNLNAPGEYLKKLIRIHNLDVSNLKSEHFQDIRRE